MDTSRTHIQAPRPSERVSSTWYCLNPGQDPTNPMGSLRSASQRRLWSSEFHPRGRGYVAYLDTDLNWTDRSTAMVLHELTWNLSESYCLHILVWTRGDAIISSTPKTKEISLFNTILASCNTTNVPVQTRSIYVRRGLTCSAVNTW